jgi:hypothetical protein
MEFFSLSFHFRFTFFFWIKNIWSMSWRSDFHSNVDLMYVSFIIWASINLSDGARKSFFDCYNHGDSDVEKYQNICTRIKYSKVLFFKKGLLSNIQYVTLYTYPQWIVCTLSLTKRASRFLNTPIVFIAVEWQQNQHQLFPLYDCRDLYCFTAASKRNSTSGPFCRNFVARRWRMHACTLCAACFSYCGLLLMHTHQKMTTMRISFKSSSLFWTIGWNGGSASTLQGWQDWKSMYCTFYIRGWPAFESSLLNVVDCHTFTHTQLHSHLNILPPSSFQKPNTHRVICW